MTMSSAPRRSDVLRERYGNVGGTDVHRYILTNGNGVTARILDYGGVLQSLDAPDRDGKPANVVLGFPTVDGYVANNNPAAARVYLGAIIGRYANRIAGGTFALDGQTYRLPRNDNGNTLHGGTAGFDTHVWSARERHGPDSVAVRLTHISPHRHQGFPGTLTTDVVYRLDNRNRLSIGYRATTNAPTVVNLTNHTYWNLAGEDSGDIQGQKLTINAGRYSPTDDALIPTGPPLPVEDTPFDFRKPTEIGARIDADDPQLRIGSGYDHNWVLDQPEAQALSFAAQAHDPVSGRMLTVWTTEPGLQFYSGNFLTEALIGSSGRPYRPHAGFALEAQHFPDSPNRPDFPSTVLRPGQTYSQRTVYALTTD
jgi:aldose 1-epimerase